MRGASHGWRSRNPERAAAVCHSYRAGHPDAVQAAWRRARARKLAAFVSPYVDSHIFERHGWVCQLCERAIDPSLSRDRPWGASIDHKVPLDTRWGGTDEPSNVWASHLRCNLRKGARFTGQGPVGPAFFCRPQDDLDSDEWGPRSKA